MKYFNLVLIPFLSAFLLWSIVKLFLPASAPIILFNFEKKIINFNLSRLFNQTYQQKQNNLNTLKNYTLKAIYQDKKRGFIILTKNKKTIFLDLGKSIDGYKLIKISQTSAIFEKNSKKYILQLQKIKPIKIENKNTSSYTISKTTINEYKNPAKIWNNIHIIKLTKGYKVTYVNKNSIFYKIGLRKGDIILEVNNTPLIDAYAWRIYHNINKYQNILITIKRNNKIKVLNYEIY